MPELVLIILCIIGAFILGMRRSPLWMWAAGFAAAMLIWQAGVLHGAPNVPAPGWLGTAGWVLAAALAALSVPAIRQTLLVQPLYGAVKRILPKVSETERAALEAGTVGFDAELFGGQPDWGKLRAVPPITLTQEEQAFLDGPTNELCGMLDDWAIRHNEREIPKEIWDFVKSHGFLGMLISKEHGGLGFSPQAQSIILGRIASRSPDVCVIVMVPNSLGPGELIEKYGTPEQKEHFLPRLAKGLEVPCFSLTGPTSGSDAATMRDVGYVTRGVHDGKETIGIRLSWEKRYITLGPDATLVGLAFRVFDPENLLGGGEDRGITVALVPADHPGVEIGRRHLPTGAAFPNGPNWGRDVFIPLDWVIGGEKMVGQGWRMLMECLAAGRSISLPSSAAAGCKSLLRNTSAYARVRKQFDFPIGKMEGLQEPLARMVENAYVTEAARGVTAAMVSRGEKPSVISAIMKYSTTERMRRSLNDAMDLHGGKGICDGPSNYLQSAYQSMPVAITVEGANILTRSLITFAQGALRSHPYLYQEIQACQDTDSKRGLAAFERAFSDHTAFAVSNLFGAAFHNLTFGAFGHVPDKAYGTAEWYRQLWRASRNFALVADMTVAVLGGGLKTRQKLTGRLADALSELYLLSCVLKRYEDDGKPENDRHVVALCARNGLYRFQEALHGTIDNFPVLPVRWLMRAVCFPLGAHYKPAPDWLGAKCVNLVLSPGETRDRLTRYIYVSQDPDDPTGLLEVAFAKAVAMETAERKLDRAVRSGHVRRVHGTDWVGDAARLGVLSEEEAAGLRELDALTARVIAVDHFDPIEVKPHYLMPGHNARAVQRAAE
ncbi:MAG TPA: acyl-CoA dehydrogenase [Hyphomicrobiaceae bacterium]|nr:acyl-CoA dehydrogenase [Hyphomicrobiaceae bacterium]